MGAVFEEVIRAGDFIGRSRVIFTNPQSHCLCNNEGHELQTVIESGVADDVAEVLAESHAPVRTVWPGRACLPVLDLLVFGGVDGNIVW